MSTVLNPMLVDYMAWLNVRVQSLMIVRPSRHVVQLVDALEVIVCDDTSATVANLATHNGDTVANLPAGLSVLALDYDGTTDRRVAFRRWLELAERHRGPGHVFGVFDNDNANVTLTYAPDEIVDLLLDVEEQERQTNTDPPLSDVRSRRSALTPSTRQRQREQRRTVTVDSVTAFVQAIDWAEPSRWVLRQARQGRVVYSHCQIDRLTDESLWHALIWLVRSRLEIRELVCDTAQTQQDAQRTPALLAAVWLRDRPVFRGLLKEALRRCLTFPPDVFDYFKRYVLDNQSTLDGYTPWSDPALRFQPEQLQGILQMPDVPIEQQVRKSLRSIKM